MDGECRACKDGAGKRMSIYEGYQPCIKLDPYFAGHNSSHGLIPVCFLKAVEKCEIDE